MILAKSYENFFKNTEFHFVSEPDNSESNYWLNTIILKDRNTRDLFLDETNNQGIMTRPIWKLMNKLTMFDSSQCGDLTTSKWLEDRVVNISSSVIL